ncbi:MAG: ribonuclease HII [Corynebacteriales bacterium]|nr:ribonuclease HII [Mycobacteriales bacterium]
MIFSTREPVRGKDLHAYERALRRRGFELIAGADEAGRGACAGPLVAAAVVLSGAEKFEILADSKKLTHAAREAAYDDIVARARAYSIVTIDARSVDSLGLHVANVNALRQSVEQLPTRPDYVLTDGFTVGGLTVPSLAVWKGDQIAGCIAAASILAKVTRDRLMEQLHHTYPQYQFAQHKGYATPEHQSALSAWGPCPEHRMRYANVRAVAQTSGHAFESNTKASGLPATGMVRHNQEMAVEDVIR